MPGSSAPARCDHYDGLAVVACGMACYTAVWLLSSLLMPALMPKTSSTLAKKPGEAAFWHSSSAALVNGVVNAALAVAVWQRTPSLLSGEDFFYKNDDTCRTVYLFVAWIGWELACQVLYWGLWDARNGILVHHVSALLAWGLYLEGGYGHALSLVGLFCEATNPFMSMRYFLSTAGMKSGRLYVANGLMFCLSWLLVRIGLCLTVGWRLVYLQWDGVRTLPAWRSTLYVLFFSLGCSLNLMWGKKLLLGAYQVLASGSHPKDS